ncbi:MAG: bifunctional folylpolyglutamate synthase/dihydrofolate synthase [Deltaproteobacteria bacterium]|nr:bifunctional folylpolyglutamate synthase/dihydrofolate synthase [Deltaproteobacteria bacterium]
MSHDDIARYHAANHYINEGLIRRDADAATPSPLTRRERMERFLPRLGHPERAFGAIHIAGTSGKGSTSVMVAEILRAAGLRTGLHVSPYLQVATEKLWVDGRFASAAQYHDLVFALRPHAEACRGPDVPMHGMASVALFLDYFRREKIDIAVIEVGVGGRNDIRNILDTRVAAITNVGPDHLKTLGPNLADIAAHKAGIIKAGCRALVHALGDTSHDGRDFALQAARAQADAVSAPLRIIRPGRDYRLLPPTSDGRTRLAYRGSQLRLDDLELATGGAFQAQNAAVAIAICEEAYPDGPVNEDAVRRGLAKARLAARLERLAPGPKNHCPVLLDGAHNPDKIAALVRALDGHRRLHLVFGGLASKHPGPATTALVQRSASVTFAEPRVYAKAPRDALEFLSKLGNDHPNARTEVDVHTAIEVALAEASPRDLVVITGSLYLAGQARSRWYPDDDVLRQRTSWP